MDAVDAKWPGGLGIGSDVVYVDGTLRVDCKVFKQYLINAWVGLDGLDLAGYEDTPEPAEKVEARDRSRIGLGRKVGEAVERSASFIQLGEDLDRAGDRPRHHFVEAGAIGVDQLGLVGMLALEQAGAFGEAAAGILTAVPLMGAHGRKKTLHHRLVAREELAVEMSRVPIDQHTAQIEDHDASASLCHPLLSKSKPRDTIAGGVSMVQRQPRDLAILADPIYRGGIERGVAWMPASIWLQLSDEQEASLRALIQSLAQTHGTVPFQPHLTVCSPHSEAFWGAAKEYVRQSQALPLRVGKKGISFSTTAPMMAVVIDVEYTPDLRTFRADLRQITGAVEPPPPHISLLYGVDQTGLRPSWSSDESRLKSIAEDCARRVDASEFALDHPVIVAPDGEWTNIKSWRMVRTL